MTELCAQNSRICIHKIISKDSTIMKRREMHTDTAAHAYAVIDIAAAMVLSID
jgi:hypothetical protein